MSHDPMASLDSHFPRSEVETSDTVRQVSVRSRYAGVLFDWKGPAETAEIAASQALDAANACYSITGGLQKPYGRSLLANLAVVSNEILPPTITNSIIWSQHRHVPRPHNFLISRKLEMEQYANIETIIGSIVAEDLNVARGRCDGKLSIQYRQYCYISRSINVIAEIVTENSRHRIDLDFNTYLALLAIWLVYDYGEAFDGFSRIEFDINAPGSATLRAAEARHHTLKAIEFFRKWDAPIVADGLTARMKM